MSSLALNKFNRNVTVTKSHNLNSISVVKIALSTFDDKNRYWKNSVLCSINVLTYNSMVNSQI